MTALSGFLLASPTGTTVTRRHLADDDQGGRRTFPYLVYDSAFKSSSRWEVYTFHSDKSFSEYLSPGLAQPPFPYPALCARSGSKLIVLTPRKDLTKYVLRSTLSKRVFPNLRQVQIHIPSIVEAFQHSDSEYVITSLHGHMRGSETALRTMSIWGSNVTNSSLYEDYKGLFDFTSCGVAKRDPSNMSVVEERELVRLSSDGSLSMQTFNRNRAAELSLIIAHIIENRWVDNWVPIGETHND